MQAASDCAAASRSLHRRQRCGSRAPEGHGRPQAFQNPDDPAGSRRALLRLPRRALDRSSFDPVCDCRRPARHRRRALVRDCDGDALAGAESVRDRPSSHRPLRTRELNLLTQPSRRHGVCAAPAAFSCAASQKNKRISAV